jgi:hypothetical protein
MHPSSLEPDDFLLVDLQSLNHTGLLKRPKSHDGEGVAFACATQSFG